MQPFSFILKHSGGRSFFSLIIGLGSLAAAASPVKADLAAKGNGALPTGQVRGSENSDSALSLQWVTYRDRTLPIVNEAVTLSSHPGATTFKFGLDQGVSNGPIRFRYRLDGYEQRWHERTVLMRMVIRFIDANDEDLAEQEFTVSGVSPGWTGSYADSPWIHRKETVTVPRGAAHFYVVISSAGPPDAVGFFAIRNLVVFPSQGATNGLWLMPPVKPAGSEVVLEDVKDTLAGWVRAGTRPANARVLRYGSGPGSGVALAILDDNPQGHADWNTIKSQAPEVMSGTKLTLEWDEVYSIGTAVNGEETYPDLPVGLYSFRMEDLTVMGVPTGRQISVRVTVPVAFWQNGWFWIAPVLLLFGFVVGTWRMVEWKRITRQVRKLERERVLEQDRTRIAQDIHDDLGARVTEIALLSSSAQLKPNLPSEVRADFLAVFRLTQELVQALHETVWAVSPKNDHLDALTSYIGQMVNQMCAQAKLGCRLDIPDISAEVPVTSQMRHHIVMAVKEIIHNTIKHARATEIQVCLRWAERALTIQMSDNGCGFDPAVNARGNGLDNVERRLHSLGGSSSLESRPGAGTRVTLEFPLPVS